MDIELMTVKAKAVGNAVFIGHYDKIKEIVFGVSSPESARWIAEHIDKLLDEYKEEIAKLVDIIEEM